MKSLSRLTLLVGSLLVLSLVVSCGGQTSSQGGEGNTIFVSAGITSGTVLSANASASSATRDFLDFTLQSTIYPNLNPAITPSAVQINHQVMTFTPQIASDGTLSPALTPVETTSTGLLSAGGTLALSIGVTDAAMKRKLYGPAFNNYSANFAANPNLVLHYDITVDFSGVEINSGKSISCRSSANLFVTK